MSLSATARPARATARGSIDPSMSWRPRSDQTYRRSSMRRRVPIARAVLVLVVIGAALASASPAGATAPVLTSVGRNVSGYATATWILPPGHEFDQGAPVTALWIEAADSPVTDADGSFLSGHLKAFDALDATQTSWTNRYGLEPGLLYFHVAGEDQLCYLRGHCPDHEHSPIMTLQLTPP